MSARLPEGGGKMEEREELEELEELVFEGNNLRWLADGYMQTQKTRIAMENRLRAISQDADNGPPSDAVVEAAECMLKAEKLIQKQMMVEIEDHPVWPWLSQVKGISGTLGCKLLGMLDIHQARHISSFWKFCGLATIEVDCPDCDGDGVVPVGVKCPKCNGKGKIVTKDRLIPGQKAPYSKRAKTVMYLIASSFLKCGSPFRKVYDDAKVYYEANRPDWTKGHIHNASMRKMEKVFLSCLWQAWRAAEDMPVEQPYAHDKMGHKQLYKPEDFI